MDNHMDLRIGDVEVTYPNTEAESGELRSKASIIGISVTPPRPEDPALGENCGVTNPGIVTVHFRLTGSPWEPQGESDAKT